jgi:hypothetical protein
MKHMILAAMFLTWTTWLSDCSGARSAPTSTKGGAPDSRARIAEDGRVVVIESEGNEVLFEVDVIEGCGKPSVGSPLVRQIDVVEGKVSVVFGKHGHASIDMTTGELECTGSD